MIIAAPRPVKIRNTEAVTHAVHMHHWKWYFKQ